MQEYAKRMYVSLEGSDVVYFWGVSSRKNICYIVKPCREIGQSFEESLREGELVYNKFRNILND